MAFGRLRSEVGGKRAESSRLKAQRKCNKQLTKRNKHSEADSKKVVLRKINIR
jgi:hypothetical protein